MLNNLLLYRLLIINLCGLALVGWAAMQGWIGPLFLDDSTRITFAILALFIVGMVAIAGRVVKVSSALNRIKSGSPAFLNPDKFQAKGDFIGDIVEACAVLGFIGTLIGLAICIVGLDPNDDYATAIVNLKDGAGVAVYTSIVGAVCGLWLTFNRRILQTATTCMLEDDAALTGYGRD